MSEQDKQEELLARITALEAVVAELRAQLNLVRYGRFRSMRDSRQCPACGGGALLHFRRVRQIGDGETLVDLSLTHGERWFSNTPQAPLEAFACRKCALVEWHVRNFDDVVADAERIVAIDPEPVPPPAGPFR